MSDISKIQLPDNSEYDIKDTVARANIDDLIEKVSDDLLIAEGNPITFETQSTQIAKETEVTMNPIQDFHGYDKPWAAGTSDQLLNESTAEPGTIDQTTGEDVPSSGVTRTDFMSTKGATDLFLSSDGSMRFFWYDSSKNYISNAATNKNTSVSVPNNTAYFRIIGINSIFTKPIMINSGTTAKTYCPYSNICPISGRTQSKIWGSGKNLLPTTLTEIKSINTTGTWSGDAYAINDVTFTVQTDGDKVVGINANGTASADATLFVYGGTTSSSKDVLFPGDIKISIGTANNGSTTTFLGVVWSTTQNKFVYGTEAVSGGYNMTGFGVRIKSGYNAQNVLFKPMIRLSDEDATFVPYVQGDDVTRNYGQTVYGGSDAIETGELTVDTMRVELDTLNWAATSTSGIFFADDNLTEFRGAGRTIIACDSFQSVDNVSGLGSAQTNPNCSICGFSGTSDVHRFYIRWDAKGTSVSDLVSALDGVYACYKLATPTTTTITAAHVNLLKGLNNVSTDADSINLTYRDGVFATLEDVMPVGELKDLAFKDKVDTSYMEPLYTNIYTGLIGSANDAAGASFYVGKIIPTSYTGIWKIHYRIYAEAAGRTDSKSWHDCWADGNRSSLRTYANYNTIVDTSYNPLRYTLVYRATEAGITGNYGHLLGVGLRDSWARTTAANSRTIKVEIIETIGCTYTPWNTAVKYANVPGTGSTNYSGLSEIDAYNTGLRETGDDNTTVHNRINYFAGKTGTTGVYAYTLFMEDENGTYQSIVTSSTTDTKTVNSHGFKVGSSIWYSNTTYAANTSISGQAVVYSAISTADSRYSFNVGLTAGALTAYKPIYLVGTINSSDGLFYLDSTWWTQTPNDSSKVYILVGGVYASTASSQQYALYEQNPWYTYDGSKLVEFHEGYLSLKGGDMSGPIRMNGNNIFNTHLITSSTDVLAFQAIPYEDSSKNDWLFHDYTDCWSILYSDPDGSEIPMVGNPIANFSNESTFYPGSPIVVAGAKGEINQVARTSESMAINHNNLYRGEELLSSSHFGTGTAGLTALHNAVSSGNFSDIYVGDTITVTMSSISGYESNSQTVEWVVMGIDIYLKQDLRWALCGANPHHLVIVPKNCFTTPRAWHSMDDITSVGYKDSWIHSAVLVGYESAIKSSLNNYLIRGLCMTSTGANTTGFSFIDGTNSGAATDGIQTATPWICLMNEVEIYGCRTISSQYLFDVGFDNIQLPGFRLNPNLIIKKCNGADTDWWLKSICKSNRVGAIIDNGVPWSYQPTYPLGVCPKAFFG